MPDKSDRSESGMEPDILRHAAPPRLKLYKAIALCGAAVIVVVGLGLRFHSSMTTAAWTEGQAVPSVRTITLGNAKTGGKLDLAGDVQAFINAQIYAQVSGTVQKWFVDIGANVKAGELLAQLDPRPYEAALAQARGQLARDSATLANARVDLSRYQSLARQGAISNQTLAAQQATVDADAGIVASDQAMVQTASINLEYTHVRAPFGGVVTSRSVDVGNLVMVGNASPTPLFTVTDLTKLRIYVHMPQIYLSSVKPGMAVDFDVPEYPGRRFTATMAASSGAVASSSGTQLLQFLADNSSGAIKPGDYAAMHFKFPALQDALRIPATALTFRDEGMMVATVDDSNHVRLKPIVIRTDLGNAVEATGISTKDRVIDDPPDSLLSGDLVAPSREPATTAPVQ